jgi:hypothetical protein
MRSTFIGAITIALSAMTAAVSAYEGFDAYTDPTLPTVVTNSRSGSAAVSHGRRSIAPPPTSETAASIREDEWRMHPLVAMRSASVPHQVAHGVHRAHTPQVN